MLSWSEQGVYSLGGDGSGLENFSFNHWAIFFFVLGSGFLASCGQEVLEQGLVEIRSELPEIMMESKCLLGLTV